MEVVRDLGRVDPWQESLERSLARRGKRPQSSGAERPRRLGDAAPRRLHDDAPRRLRDESLGRGRDKGRRRSRATGPGRFRTRRGRTQAGARPRGGVRWDRLLTAGSGGFLAVVFLVVVSAGGFPGRGAQASVDSSHASAFHEPRPSRAPQRNRGAVTFTRLGGPAPAKCLPAGSSSGYVNPLAGDVLRGERIDQGVDYAGTGAVRALGAGRITYVGTSETGWPGAFIEYRLLAGPDAGCFVYYAEGITPVAGMHAGETVRPGQRLAGIIPGWPTGIELGWGAGTSTKTYAARAGKWSPTDDADNVASAAGRSFSALIAALGGPAGKVEG